MPYRILYILLLPIFWGSEGHASEIFYKQGTRQIQTFDALIDETGSLQPGDVVNATFKKHQSNFGITQNTIWLKLLLTNQSSYDSLYIEIKNPILEEATFYRYENGRIINEVQISRNFRYSQRPVTAIPNYVYPIFLKNNQSVTIFVRIRSNTPIHLPVYIGSARDISAQIFSDVLLVGLFFGIVAVMFFYNFFIYLTVKDKGYLYYIFYIFFVGMAQLVLNGYAAKFFWPDSQWLSANGFILSGVFSGVATGVFTQNFLKTRYFTPGLNKLINLMIALYLLGLVLHFLGFKYLAFNMVNIFAATGSTLIIFTAYKIVRQNYVPARYFLVAFSIFLLAVIIYVLRTANIVPYNGFTAYILEIGAAIQITLLSFALADKINVYMNERAQARREALRVSQENEKLVREQNIVLEKEVKARTSELENANNDLSQTLSQLKLAQAKLVDSEKMASLGQLTAGVAHEINNPINFVTSNIRPLELDINDIFEVLKKYENINPSIEVKPQLEKIDAFKKEIDIDYIGQEIKSLLLGIKDGATRTAEIVKNLKNFVRLDQSNLKAVNLNEGIESTLVLIRNTFPKNMLVEKNLEELSLVECAPGKINQVFMNIITNAVQAIGAKNYTTGEVPKLTINSWQQGTGVNISIKDNGIGMSDEVVKKIYEPFFTTKDVGEGTGLGMSIVKGIIESHNGNLEIQSSEGMGTEFVLTLPIRFA
ncbi:MAG: hypothetical protein BGN92_14555 [Sphingobacteriales bacterium 41-5]|nr:MAG: hypothetical protein BGN92_14555 [Sphingobacteriales bacterium 41-5]